MGSPVGHASLNYRATEIGAARLKAFYHPMLEKDRSSSVFNSETGLWEGAGRPPLKMPSGGSPGAESMSAANV
jgi:hypothetical protein